MPAVKNVAKSLVNEIELLLVEPKSNGEIQALAMSVGDQRVVDSLVIFQVGAIEVDRLLEISDHAKAAGRRRIRARFHPIAGRTWWARRFQKHGELRRLRILRLVKNDAVIFLANSPGCDRMPEQLPGQRNLVAVSDEAALEPKIEKSALHFGGDVDCGVINPSPQGRKCFAPEFGEVRVLGRETN